MHTPTDSATGDGRSICAMEKPISARPNNHPVERQATVRAKLVMRHNVLLCGGPRYAFDLVRRRRPVRSSKGLHSRRTPEATSTLTGNVDYCSSCQDAIERRYRIKVPERSCTLWPDPNQHSKCVPPRSHHGRDGDRNDVDGPDE